MNSGFQGGLTGMTQPSCSVCPSELATAWTGETQTVIIDHKNIHKPGVRDLLETAYKDLYVHTFPVEKGGEALGKWLKCLTDTKSEYDYRIVIAGSHLRNCQRPVVKGICVGTYYKSTDTGMLSYIVVDPACRSEELGKRLTALQGRTLLSAAKEHGNPLRGWFLECNDPEKVPDTKDGYGAHRRLEKYESWGGKVVPLLYRVPDVSSSSRKTDKLLLISFPHPGTHMHPGRSTVVDFLHSVYKDLDVRHPKRDKTFRKATKSVLRGPWRRHAGSGEDLFGDDSGDIGFNKPAHELRPLSTP